MAEKRPSRKRQMVNEVFPGTSLPSVSRPVSRGSCSDKAFNCPICVQLFREPYSTACGHTFCRSCITEHINGAQNPKCPLCGFQLDPGTATLFPNHVVSTMTDKYLNDRRRKIVADVSAGDRQKFDLLCDQIMAVTELSSMEELSEVVTQRKQEMQQSNEQRKNLLMNEFLHEMIRRRESNLESIKLELEILRADERKISEKYYYRTVPDAAASTSEVAPEVSSEDALAAASATAKVPNVDSEFEKYRIRMRRHFDGLQDAYIATRINPGAAESGPSAPTAPRTVSSCAADVDDFTEVLRGVSQYGEIRKLASLNYNVEAAPMLSIVSSIEFDKDGEYFVVAGVTKKIKVYDYKAVIDNKCGFHYPMTQLQCSSKISNVSWNPYTKNLLASSDYDGTVQLWDTYSAQKLRSFREHEKRCWTVQFNNVDPHLMASGSDDSKVKLWNVSTERSVATIDARVNVCCVYFSPTSRYNLVFGCADHCVHLYDIRHPTKAVNVFRGHRKAVSYVKYCNEREVVSASTDSNLRVWDVNSGKCLRTMKGHTNEKNFVGLATDGNHIVCGSENNQLYLYYKGLSAPLMNYDFATSEGADTGEFSPMPPTEVAAGTSDFVSAVCWKKNSNVIVAANSQGTTQILELV
ncbi:hypothetical protein QR680_017545 [Steinernema hermaphroditum]|uniref:RING-type domain-containing protein n=1 Tax=Steinernema hermaphroditum TaxID=289476 RepID=A0AA39HFK3_9BILA|nr:hypothetical protein QR680_017545 [Steinernema hermaphroditum]